MDKKGKRPDWVPPVEPGKPDEPPKRPDIPHREVKPERPHGGEYSEEKLDECRIIGI